MATLVNHNPNNSHNNNKNGHDALPTPKQIRFVNNQGQPPTKRRRINAACLTCRRRKTRCAGEQPTCSTCTKNGHTCLGYTDGLEKKKESVGGPTLVAIDATRVEPDNDDDDADNDDDDDDDYLPIDDELEVYRKQQWKKKRNGNNHNHNHNNNHNNNKQSDTTDDVPACSRPLSDLAHDPATTPTMQLKSETMEWEQNPAQHTPRPEPLGRRPTNPRNHSFSTQDDPSPTASSPVQYHTEGQSVPYFRFFGPTAIVPGFKQMVVKVKDNRRSSMSATSPSTGSMFSSLVNSMPHDHELHQLEDMPLYDVDDTNPVPPLILHLVDTFFLHLGSNYPFLRRNKFRKLVQEKRVEPILVDSVCALAARFSDHPLFRNCNDGKLAKSEYGCTYAQRAKAATVDTFPCPSVSAVQACLLMAYDSFGADQDSALWMYLGIAIRMAVDLGLTKEDGVRYQGEKDPWYTRDYNRANDFPNQNQQSAVEDSLSPQEQMEVEQERIDTFWAVFFLDRVISSGVGRPVTLKDDDFELAFPKSGVSLKSGWPDPFPSLLQIIHLYGRVSDVLNKIVHAQDLTQDKLDKLVHMENELTRFHQKTHARLRFDANNFQAHVKNGQGTTFILLHLWFHALIIVLHQPTLLTKDGTISRAHQLRPHSRELSMSSAKTIADILAFAELLDPKCFIGNPFTSQPIYIAACAFLVESKSSGGSQSVSGDVTPSCEAKSLGGSKGGIAAVDSGPSSRHHLLASAANQNYQACYKALKQMHTYWGGVRYILTALDQKLEGHWDCETYTIEEYERTRRKQHNSAIHQFTRQLEFPASPIPDNGPPLAWSLTGTTNSPNSSLTLLFQNPVGNSGLAPPQGVQPSQSRSTSAAPVSASTPPGNMIYDPIRQSLPEATGSMYPPAYPQPNTSALRHSVSNPRRFSSSSAQGKSYLRYESLSEDDPTKGPTMPDGKMPLAMPTATQGTMSMASASFTPPSQHSSGYDPSGYATGASPSSTTQSQTIGTAGHSTPGGSGTAYSSSSADGGPSNFAQSGSGLASSGYSYLGPAASAGGLHLLTYDNETDIGQHLTSFESTEMLSWFGDYFPGDMLGLFPGDSSAP
ncbi:fungal-specific transcription factor domain-containing protein [Xylariaceae sp. FL0662B]|nr:fungal-specific transcription factor domain-containing protein [Xylariaceae sp. FL0662B]